jgi:hypothetical protein
MLRAGALSLVLIGSAIAAPPPREDDAGKILRLYGEVLDPDNDCKFTLTGTKIAITVPGSDHILAFERGKTNAPRVLKEQEGDFTATVTLDGGYPKTAKSVVMGRNPFNGAGLLIYADDKNYIRFERARVLRPEQTLCYASWELWQDGDGCGPVRRKTGNSTRINLCRSESSGPATNSTEPTAPTAERTGKTWSRFRRSCRAKSKSASWRAITPTPFSPRRSRT